MKSTYFAKVLCVVLILSTVSCVPPATAAPTPQPSATPVFTTSEEFSSAAWKAYEAKDFDTAIEFATECVSKWESEAIAQQSTLTQAPPKGEVSEDEKKAIFANWALNDVGTAYLIIGMSLQEQGKADEAREAYEKVKMFPYARAWDPQGWFWSPEEEASKRLGTIQ